MKKTLLKILGISLLFSLVACSNPSTGNGGKKENPENPETPEQPENPEPEQKKPYLRFAVSKAVDNEYDLNSVSTSDEYWEMENKLFERLAFGCYKNSYIQIRSFKVDNSIDFENYFLDGNSSSETKLFQWTNNRGYKFPALYIAEDETSEKVTVTVNANGTDLSKSVDFYVCSKKLTMQDVPVSMDTVAFEKPVYIDREGYKILNKLIAANPSNQFNFDFSNCWFALNEVPYGALCSPKGEYNSFGEKNVLKVEEWGFGNIEKVKLPACLWDIKMGAFYGCYNLTTEFPSTLRSIDSMAFAGCKKIDNSTLSPDVTLSGKSFSGSDMITEVYMNSYTAYIDAFSYCKNLKTIRLGKEVKNINLDSYPMYGNIIVDESNEDFKSEAGILYSKDGTVLYKVTNTNSGYSFTVPSTVTSISRYAINYCQGLYELRIPASVKTIGSYAIYGNYNLKNIYIDLPSKPEDWDDNWVIGGYNPNTERLVEPELHWIGKAESEDPGTGSEGETGTLAGTYKVSVNERCTLKFTGKAVERFDNGRSVETYTYTLSGNTFVLTSNRTESKDYPGEFEIVFTDKGFTLNKKNDTAMSWIGLWTYAKSTETVEFVR